MIRPIDIKLNAAHPELPLVEATTFTGAPSSVFIRGVPKSCGNWSITAINVAVTYPDNSTTTRAAVESAEGVWVATIPGTATSGRTAAGFKIMADGIDENGAAVTGYVLGFADFSVLSFTPVPAPGGTFYLLRYFDQAPATPKEGDVAKIDGVLKFYNGSAWEPFAAPVTLDNTVTRTSANGVKSSGIWAAIWGALASLPTGFTSLYDWCVSQLAGKASTADATLTERGFSEWTVVPSELETEPVIAEWTADGWIIKGEDSGSVFTLVPKGDADSTSLSWTSPDEALANITATRTALSGYQLGSQTTKPLASEAEAEALRQGKLDKSGAVWNVSYTEDGLRIADTAGVYYVDISPNGIKTNFPNADHVVFWPINGGTLALLQNLAPAFSTSATYALNALCVYEGVLYRCTTAVTTAGAWTGSTNWMQATVEDVLEALRTGKANRASNPTAGNLAALDANGNPTDSAIPAANVALKGDIPYNLVTKTIHNNTVALNDRASNAVTISATLSPNTLTINFPTATSGKVRDFAMSLNIAAGVTAPEIAWPQGVMLENDGGEVPEIADGGTGGSSTILYFSETENNGTTAKFLVKGETLTAIAQA